MRADLCMVESENAGKVARGCQLIRGHFYHTAMAFLAFKPMDVGVFEKVMEVRNMDGDYWKFRN